MKQTCLNVCVQTTTGTIGALLLHELIFLWGPSVIFFAVTTNSADSDAWKNVGNITSEHSLATSSSPSATSVISVAFLQAH